MVRQQKKRRGPLALAGTVIVSLAVISALPLATFYLSKAKSPKEKNEAVVQGLKGLAGDRFSFIVMGDTENGLFLNDAAALKIIGGINREGRFKKVDIDSVFIVGDNVFRGSRADYSIHGKMASRIRFPVVWVPGNHDYDNGGEERFAKFMGQNEFAFASRNSYFIVLDNNEGDLSGKQLAWLADELEKGRDYAHRFVFLHKPPFNPYQQSWYRIETTDWPRRFMKLCEKHKVDIVFSGHEHMFKEVKFSGVRYVVTGGGGALSVIPTWDGAYYHYVRVNVNGDYVSYEVRRVTPPLWLFLTYELGKDLFTFVRGFIV